MSIEHLKLLIQIITIKLQILLLKKKLTVPTFKSPNHIVIHHDAGNNNFATVNNWHKQKWNWKSSLGFYCGYYYFLEKSGKVYQARRDNEEAAHTVGKQPHYWNRNSIGICLQGNFNNETPSLAQVSALRELLFRLEIKYKIPKTEIYGHREISSTTLCPGKHLEKLIRDYKTH